MEGDAGGLKTLIILMPSHFRNKSKTRHHVPFCDILIFILSHNFSGRPSLEQLAALRCDTAFVVALSSLINELQLSHPTPLLVLSIFHRNPWDNTSPELKDDMLKIFSLAIAAFVASLSVSDAFLDCTHLDPDSHEYKLEQYLCEDAPKRCPAHQTPIVFDFSEIPHRYYANELKIPLFGYEHAAIAVVAMGNTVDYKYRAYTPDMAGRHPTKGVGWTNQEYGGSARVMDTAHPGADLDLGTPNEHFLDKNGNPGPGVGKGGESGFGINDKYLGNAMFIQERAKRNVDDTRFGGMLKYDFSDVKGKLTITKVGLLDIEYPERYETSLYKNKFETDQGKQVINAAHAGGDNGFVEFPLFHGKDLSYLKLTLFGSGAIVYMKGKCDRFDSRLLSSDTGSTHLILFLLSTDRLHRYY